METINELKEKIHFYKLTIQDMKEHYGEFEMETNQEIKELQERIDKAVEYIEHNYFITGRIEELHKILKGEKEND